MCDVHFDNGDKIVEVGTLTPGDDITTFQLNGFKCGIAICYDGCFDEFIKLYGKAGKLQSFLIEELFNIGIGFLF